MIRIETERLVLRPWQDADRQHYISMNADPLVRRYFHPPLKSAADTNRMIDDMIADLADNGFGFLVAERRADGTFLGEVGLALIDQPTRDAMRRPADIEIGWMFAKEHWGHGYATEAARAWLDHAWQVLRLPELVSLAYAGNRASQRVMQKLGMTRDPADDYEDPTVPFGHYQRPHVVYRARNPLL